MLIIAFVINTNIKKFMIELDSNFLKNK